jgi:hypothetical protein
MVAGHYHTCCCCLSVVQIFITFCHVIPIHSIQVDLNSKYGVISILLRIFNNEHMVESILEIRLSFDRRGDIYYFLYSPIARCFGSG